MHSPRFLKGLETQPYYQISGLVHPPCVFSEFMSEVDSGRIVKVEIQGNNIKGLMSDGSNFSTYSPNYPNLVDKLSEKEISIVATPI